MKTVIVLLVLAAYVASDETPSYCRRPEKVSKNEVVERAFHEAVMNCFHDEIQESKSGGPDEACIDLCSLKEMGWMDDEGYYIHEELLKEAFPFQGSYENRAFLARELQKCNENVRLTSYVGSEETDCIVHHETLECAEEAFRKECRSYQNEETTERLDEMTDFFFNDQNAL